MKAKLYRILHGQVDGHYAAELATEATVNNVLDVVKQAKRRFKLYGKLFILVTDDHHTFLITRIEKKWLSYELKGPDHELPLE